MASRKRTAPLTSRRAFIRVLSAQMNMARSGCPKRRLVMRSRLAAVALVTTIAAVSAGAVAIAGGSDPATPAAKQKPLQFEQHDLYIEYNASAGDAGLQLGADAES